MGLLKGLLDGVVDIVALPVRAVTAVADEVLDTDITDSVNRVVEKTKGNDEPSE